jgi:hypothetical protein
MILNCHGMLHPVIKVVQWFPIDLDTSFFPSTDMLSDRLNWQVVELPLR